MRIARVASGILIVAVFAGCGGVVSKEVRREAVPLGGFEELRAEPDRYRGQTVILGGEIIETRNRAGETVLVVLEKPLQSGDRPRGTDASGGRFLARFSRYLDPVVFEKGRKVTVAGTVLGTDTEKVGDAPYTYVVLEGKELHLWREPEPSRYPYPYDPWWPWWYDPFWGGPHRRW
jgi:outer membrane lipoprotein